MENAGYAALQVIPSMRGFSAQMNKELAPIMAQQGKAAGESLGTNASNGFGKTIGGMSKYAKVAAIGVGAALGAGGLAAIKWGVGLAAANEQAQISFETMLGSATKAKSFLDDLRDFAAKTPFEFPELQTAASSLISAGVEASKVIPIMTTLGDVTAGMGTGSEGIKRATVALQQMQAAGKITGEDLNQLRDAGIPVYDLLAAATGKAKTEVAALAQAGKLGKTELEQLMTALESGKGLERFSGLMDKQSQSLTGLFSTLKDNLGQGLATAMEPAVGQLKDLLPVVTDLSNKALPLLADGLIAGIDAGRDFAGWAGPIAEDVGSHLMPVLEDLADIAGDVLPDAFGLMGGAVVGVSKVLNPLLDAIAVGTGFLADHEGAVVAVAGAYAAWKLVGYLDGAGAAFDRFAIKAYDAVGTSTTVKSLGQIGSGAKDVASQIFAVPDAMDKATPRVAGGVSKMKDGFKGLASSAAGAVVVTAGLAAGVAAIVDGLSKAHSKAQSAMDAMKPRHFDDRNITDLDKYAASLDIAAAKAEKSDDAAGGFLATLKGAAQLLSPAENKILDTAIAAGDWAKAAKIAGDASERLQDQFEAVSGKIGNGLVLSLQDVQRWVLKLDLDPATMSTSEMADAITEARNAANSGTPETDKLSEAYKVLADETANSTDKIDAWKSALDAALGNKLDISTANVNLQQSLDDMRQTFHDNAWGTFNIDIEQGRNNVSALTDSIKAAQDVANAYADSGKPEAAAMYLKRAREQIIAAGTEAGVSEEKMKKLLDQYGLTPDLINTQVALTGDDVADKKMKWLNAQMALFSGPHPPAELLVLIKTLMDNTPAGAPPTATPYGPIPGNKNLQGGGMPSSLNEATGGNVRGGGLFHGATVHIGGDNSRRTTQDLDIWSIKEAQAVTAG